MLKSNRLKAEAIQYGWLIAMALVLLAFVAVEIKREANTSVISNLDYFPLVDRAVQLSFSSWDAWVDWIHPVGFPWLVRLGLIFMLDAAHFGQALSILGGVLGLIGAYALAWAVSKSHKFALVCQIFTAAAGYYLYYSNIEGNDMLAAGLQLLAVGTLAVGLVKSADGEAPAARWIALSALLVGLAYLTRYTGLITAGVGFLVLAGIAMWQRKRQAWKVLGLYMMIIVIVTALQWIPSWIVKGSPLSNDQGQNVWFHVYGKSDFLTEWNTAPKGITLTQVFLLDPGKLVRHWWDNFQSFWISTKLTLIEEPLKLFGLAGLLFMLIAGAAIRWSVRSLIGLFVLLHIAALSLMRLDPRFLIIMIPILTIGAVYLFWRILPRQWRIGRVRVPVQLIAVIVGLLFALRMPIGFADAAREVDPAITAASDVLHAAGMRDAREVLSTDLHLQDAQAVSRERFAQANQLSLPHDTLTNLLTAAHAQQFRFLIYDKEAGPKIYPELQALLTPEAHMPGLAPIYIEPDQQFTIYRIEDDQRSTAQPIARLEKGLVLQDYAVNVSRPATSTLDGRDLGVLLRWRADRPLDTSYKVFVHVVDENGQVVAQDDSLPVVWTYPTDAWKPNEIVSDFHWIRLPNIERGKPYTVMVGLYDEATGARLNQLDASGKVVDDKIVLQQLNLDAPVQ